MSIGLLRGRSQPGSVVTQPGSVLQSVTVIDSPQSRGVKKTIVVKLRSSMTGHITTPGGTFDATGKPNLSIVGRYDYKVGQLVRFPKDEAEVMIERSMAIAVDVAG